MNKYREVINPPLSYFSFLIFLYLSLAFAIWAAFDFFQALVTMLVLLATIPIIWIQVRMVITLGDELTVDRAHIDLKYLIDPKAIDEVEYKRLRSTGSDARSFHATRPWLKRGVQVFVNDERDPTTYWLIGCKDSEALIKHIRGR